MVASCLLQKNLGKISCSLLVIPMHSADCERGFSTLGRIKTKLRSRLTNSSLNSLLMISMEGPPIQKFDVEPCLEKWRSVRNRSVSSGTPVQSASSIGTQT